ncbi:MAG: tetraacyldisaccharide 4'-kinase, partial [Pseudomonadota bacterium]
YPVSLLFALVVYCRKWCYKRGVLGSVALDKPVVVVGNITAGGAGKTPLVIALVKHLDARGLSVGVLCGGYGGRARGGPPIVVNAQTDAELAGDEAIVIARQTGVPVVVAKDRASGAQQLQAQCDCIICDDGLQHYRLQRNVEIVVVDAQKRFGNGWMMPAGPLREPVRRLQSADLVCYSGAGHPTPGYELHAEALINLHSHTRVVPREFPAIRVHAVAGIAHPDKFFGMLRSLGFDPIEHPLPDHYSFNSETLHFNDNLPVIMTEKDAVKCTKFARDNTWYLLVSAQPDRALLEQFDQLIGQPGD